MSVELLLCDRESVSAPELAMPVGVLKMVVVETACDELESCAICAEVCEGACEDVLLAGEDDLGGAMADDDQQEQKRVSESRRKRQGTQLRRRWTSCLVVSISATTLEYLPVT